MKYFKELEFACKCPGYCSHEFKASPILTERLDVVRSLLGRPIVITSGTRCEQWNKEMGGKSDSGHLVKQGLSYAADIRYGSGREGYMLLNILLEYFDRVGIAKNFIHVDCDPYLPKQVIWTY